MSLIPSGFSKNAAGGAGFYDYLIDGSLRFNDNDSAYLSRTPSSAGNRKTWTWSAWIKRGNLGSYQYFFHCGTTSATGNYGDFGFDSSDRLFLGVWAGPVLTTNRVFRDPSAWYHIVISVDTTQASASDRLKFYVNGEEETSFATDSRSSYYTLNYDTAINQALQHSLSSRHPYYADGYLDGYMAEVNFIDGTALDATSFGEEVSGAWKPIEYTGSYGTNGFYLDFDGTYYNDKSGNGNNFTANNLAATDVVLDSPTNNFATLNPLDVGGTATFSEGNLKYNTAGTTWTDTRASMGISSGKWYWETNVLTVATFRPFVGIINTAARLASNGGSSTEQLGETTNSYAYWVNGAYLRHNATNLSPSPTSASAGDIVQIALDMDNGNIWFGLNNTWYNSGNPSAGTGSTYSGITLDEVAPAFETYSTTSSLVANFGQDSSFAGNKTAQGNTDDNGYGDFYYAPPTGYLALCTANIQNDMPESLDPAQDGSPQDHFNTVLYTGQTASSTFVDNGDGTWTKSSVGFDPDLVWIKKRSGSESHELTDRVRGDERRLSSNSTSNESAGGVSLATDGFSLLETYGTDNESGYTYVAWNWKAGGSAVSNTSGDITSSVSANTDAGFSIVGYTGDGTSGTRTIGCGLTKKPDLVILKNRTEDSVSDTWFVYGTPLGSSSPSPYLTLYNTDGVATSGVFVDTSFSDNSGDALFAVSGSYNGVNKSATTYIAYCFHNVEGFSKIGSYTGTNVAASNAFVYCGFKPAFVMIKSTSTGGTYYDWVMYDNARSPYNAVGEQLAANLPDSTDSTRGVPIDFLSNGFKIRNSYAESGSNQTYIFMAFAENPFKYANAR